jgi:hypothetical protein
MPGYNSPRRGTVRMVPNIFVLFYLLFLCCSMYFCFLSFCVLFLCKCVLHCCQRVSTQLQFTNISYIITFQWVLASSFTGFVFLDHTQRQTTVGRTPLDEWSARRRDFYLTKHNVHNRKTFTFPVEFEPTISAGERPLTYALDRAATGYGKYIVLRIQLTGQTANTQYSQM